MMKKHRYEYEGGVDVREAKCNSAYDRGEEVITITYKSGPLTTFTTNHDPPLEGVKKVKIKKIRVPRTYYEFQDTGDRTLTYQLGANPSRNAVIAAGTFTPLQLATVLTFAIRNSHADGAAFRVAWETSNPTTGAGAVNNKTWEYPGKFVFFNTVGSFSILWGATSPALCEALGAPFTASSDGSSVSNSTQTSAVDGASGFDTIVSTNPANVVRFPVLYVGSNVLSSLFKKGGRITKYTFVPGSRWVNNRVTTKDLSIVASIEADAVRKEGGMFFSDFGIADRSTGAYSTPYSGWSGTGWITKELENEDDGYFFSPIPVTLKNVDFSLMNSTADWFHDPATGNKSRLFSHVELIISPLE